MKPSAASDRKPFNKGPIMSTTPSRLVGLAALSAFTLVVAIGCGTTTTTTTTTRSASGPGADAAGQSNYESASRDSGSHPVAFADAAGSAQLLADAPSD